MKPFLNRILLLCLVALLCPIARASTVFANGGDLVVNGMTVIHFSRPFHALGPEARATFAAHRLKHLAYWGSVTIDGAAEDRTVMIGAEVVCGVGADDATELHTSVPELASHWAAKLKQAMDLPPLQVSDNFVKLGVGKSRVITVIGTQSSKVTAQSSNSSIATVTKAGGGYSIKGISLGSTTVTFAVGNLQENVQVDIQPYAAVLPQSFEVQVTGSPATADTVRGAAEGIVKTKLQALPDAQIAVTSPDVAALDSGKTSTLTFGVTANSPTGIAVKGAVEVTIQNLGDFRGVDDYLWYSNKPENVKRFQCLFSSRISTGNRVRLLYHHLNGMTQDMYLRVEAVNDSTVPATLAITPGDCKPEIDPVNAGLAAASQFVRGWMYGSAEIVTIPPGSVLPISFRRLSPGETGSGLCELRLVAGPASLQVRTDSLPRFDWTTIGRTRFSLQCPGMKSEPTP